MNKPKFDSFKILFFLLSIIVVTIYSGCKIYPKKNQVNLDRTWSVYKADAEGTGYSILNEINKNTIQNLGIAWTHKFSDAPPGSRGGNSESNPIVVDGVMYTLSARHRVYALDATTGKQIWAFDPFNGEAGGGIGRGVTYWEEGSDKRILLTAGDKLYALNAQTG